MVKARGSFEWSQTAAIVAKIHNVNCAKRSDMIRDSERLNPYAERILQHPTERITIGELAARTGGKVPVTG